MHGKLTIEVMLSSWTDDGKDGQEIKNSNRNWLSIAFYYDIFSIIHCRISAVCHLACFEGG